MYCFESCMVVINILFIPQRGKICLTLCQVLSPEDYENIMRVTDTPEDAQYQKSKYI